MRDISEAAELSLGAMYNHFKSKEELSYVLFSHAIASIAHELRQRAIQSDTLEKKLEEMIKYVFYLIEKDPDLITFIFLQRHQNLEKLNWGKPNPYAVFHFLIQQNITQGRLPNQDVDIATAMVMGSIIQTIDTFLLGGIQSLSKEEIVEQIIRGIIGILDSPNNI